MNHTDYWQEGDFESSMGITCRFKRVCPFHPEIMMLVKHCNVQAFSLRQDDDWDSRAVDVVMTCPECGYIDVFGVAISLEHYDAIQQRLLKDSLEGVYKVEEKRIRVPADSEGNVSVGIY